MSNLYAWKSNQASRTILITAETEEEAYRKALGMMMSADNLTIQQAVNAFAEEDEIEICGEARTDIPAYAGEIPEVSEGCGCAECEALGHCVCGK